MRWEDERYIKLYTRDTPEWCALSFGARGLFCLILRAVDRAGILPLGKLGPKGVAVAVRASWAEVEPLLGELTGDGCVTIRDERLLVPNFLTAQEAVQTDAARKRASREKARSLFGAGSTVSEAARAAVTKADSMPSQNGTALTSQNGTHGPGHVTSSHAESLRDETRRSETSLDKTTQAGRARVKSDDTSPEAQRAEPSELATAPAVGHPEALTIRIFEELFRKRYKRDFQHTSFGHPKSDEWAFIRIAKLAAAEPDPERWLRHVWREFLRDDDRFLVKNAHAPRFLEGQLNKYGKPKKAKPAEPPKPDEKPAPPARPFVPLPVVSDGKAIRGSSTPEALAEKARADKARLEATFGKDEKPKPTDNEGGNS